MTDNEIIKALECCGIDRCDECPCYTEQFGCDHNLQLLALDLINRLKAEIERLHNILLSFTNEVSMWSDKKGYDTSEISLIPILDKAKNIKAEVKAEAVKEFAEIIVADYPEMEYYLDDLVKEFTEGEKQ